MSGRRKTKNNAWILIIAVALITTGAYLSIPVNDEPPYEGWIRVNGDWVNPNIPSYPDFVPEPDVTEYETKPVTVIEDVDGTSVTVTITTVIEPRPTSATTGDFLRGNIFGGDGSVSIGNILLFLGIGLFVIGIIMGRK